MKIQKRFINFEFISLILKRFNYMGLYKKKLSKGIN